MHRAQHLLTSKAKIISECLYLNGAKNHFLEFSIFSTIHLNMFLNIFHATLGIKLILSKHRTEETNDELMMPLVKRINTYICTYLSMYESKYKNYHQNNDELTHVPIS